MYHTKWHLTISITEIVSVTILRMKMVAMVEIVVIEPMLMAYLLRVYVCVLVGQSDVLMVCQSVISSATLSVDP